MAAAFTGEVTGSVRRIWTPDSGIYAGVPNDLLLQLRAIFRESGTIADKINAAFVKRISFTSSTQQTINLSAAVGDDGLTHNFVEIVVQAIRLRTGTAAASLTIDNAGATTPFTGFLNAAGTLKIFPSTLETDGTTIKNSGFHIQCAPNDPAAVVGSGVNVRLLPSAHNFDADVVFLGRLA